MLCRKTSPWQHNLNQKASGKPGAVQPTVECTLKWESDPILARYLSAVFDIQNKYSESLIVECIEVIHPPNIMLSPADTGSYGATGRFQVSIKAGKTGKIIINRQIDRSGEYRELLFPSGRGRVTDRTWIKTCITGIDGSKPSTIKFSIDFTRAGFASKVRRKKLRKTYLTPVDNSIP